MEQTTFAVSRRVNGRRFLLRPDALLTALFVYAIGALAPPLGIQVNALTVMSTHVHLVLSTSDQRISKFFEVLNASLAKAINVLRRLPRGIVWAPGELNMVELKTPDAVVFQIAYAIVNPVAAGLVWRPEDWAGLCVLPQEIGRRVFSAARPAFFFDPVSWPAMASFRVELPACLIEAYGETEARRRIAAEVERQIREAHARIKAKRWKVAGALRAKSTSPYRRAKSWEDFGELNPRIAVGPGNHDARREATEELQTFRADYRAAWKKYQAGETDVEFPYGTYIMRVRHHVRVAKAPS